MFYNFTWLPSWVRHSRGWPSDPGSVMLLQGKEGGCVEQREPGSGADLAGLSSSPAAYLLRDPQQVPASLRAPRALLLHSEGSTCWGSWGRCPSSCPGSPALPLAPRRCCSVNENRLIGVSLAFATNREASSWVALVMGCVLTHWPFSPPCRWVRGPFLSFLPA